MLAFQRSQQALRFSGEPSTTSAETSIVLEPPPEDVTHRTHQSSPSSSSDISIMLKDPLLRPVETEALVKRSRRGSSPRFIGFEVRK